MNSVILFFPYRGLLTTLTALTRVDERRASAAAAALYAALVCVLLLHPVPDGAPSPPSAAAASGARSDASDYWRRYDGGFPTGRLRSDLSAKEIALYVGGPGLYAVPLLASSAARRHWGHPPSMCAA